MVTDDGDGEGPSKAEDDELIERLQRSVRRPKVRDPYFRLPKARRAYVADADIADGSDR